MKMTYGKTMKQKCKCGKFGIGGWLGSKRNGKPSFGRLSASVVTGIGIAMCEEHTVSACYAPKRIA